MKADDEYNDLLRSAVYDAAGRIRVTPAAAGELLRGLDVAEQAHRAWAEYHRERLLEQGARKDVADFVAKDKAYTTVDGFGRPLRVKPVRHVRRVERREDGTELAYWQPTLWDEMSRADLVQVKAREDDAAEQRAANAKIAGRLIDLCDRHDVDTVQAALAAEGFASVEEWLAA